MKRHAKVLAGCVAVTAAVVAVVLGLPDAERKAGAAAGDDVGGTRAGASVARIQFTEAAPLDADQSVMSHRKVEMFAEHRGDEVSTLRFVVTIDGRVAEERLWRADRPGSITARNWDSCTTADEPTPAPEPDSLDVILRGYFGPREVPRDAEKDAGGASRWETPTGMMLMAYTDLGGPYPDRVVEIKGPDGSIGSTISGTRISDHPSLPEWRAGWQECRPAPGAV
ncbi:hypothetical protein ABZ572_25690 [Streptomyces sp. NPDC018338]|uniref:hypothetical protein n=1 Tax=Streptomyces sp. NPDC018338 TaxID=3157192 RepID=UPI00340D2426